MKKIGKTTLRAVTIRLRSVILFQMGVISSFANLDGAISQLYGWQKTKSMSSPPSSNKYHNHLLFQSKNEPPCRPQSRQICPTLHRNCPRRDKTPPTSHYLLHSPNRSFSFKPKPSSFSITYPFWKIPCHLFSRSFSP